MPKASDAKRQKGMRIEVPLPAHMTLEGPRWSMLRPDRPLGPQRTKGEHIVITPAMQALIRVYFQRHYESNEKAFLDIILEWLQSELEK